MENWQIQTLVALGCSLVAAFISAFSPMAMREPQANRKAHFWFRLFSGWLARALLVLVVFFLTLSLADMTFSPKWVRLMVGVVGPLVGTALYLVCVYLVSDPEFVIGRFHNTQQCKGVECYANSLGGPVWYRLIILPSMMFLVVCAGAIVLSLTIKGVSSYEAALVEEIEYRRAHESLLWDMYKGATEAEKLIIIRDAKIMYSSPETFTTQHEDLNVLRDSETRQRLETLKDVRTKLNKSLQSMGIQPPK